MDAFSNGGIKADGAQVRELLDDALESLVAWRAGWLPRPGQHTRRCVLLGPEQSVQGLGLGGGQAAGELSGDMALCHDQDGGDQSFDDARTWSDDLAPAQFVHQR